MVSNQNNKKFEVNLVKKISSKQKKLLLVVPFIIATAVTCLYFLTYEDNPKNHIDFKFSASDVEGFGKEKQEAFFDLGKRNQQENRKNIARNSIENKGKNDVIIKNKEEKQLKKTEKKISSNNGQYNSSSNVLNDNSKTNINTKIKEEELEEVDEEEEFDDSPIVVWTNPTKHKELKRMVTAKIAGTQDVSSKNPIVYIRLLEDMEIANVTIPRNTNVQANASFDANRVYLNIKHISYKGNSIDTDITVTNSEGYPGLGVNGGTGAEVEQEDSSDSKNLVRTTFKKTVKVKLNGDYVLLKNTKK